MKWIVNFILNFFMSVLVVCVLNFRFFEKRRYRKLKRLNAQMDILLKSAELKNKGIPIPKHIQSYIRELYETTKEG